MRVEASAAGGKPDFLPQDERAGTRTGEGAAARRLAADRFQPRAAVPTAGVPERFPSFLPLQAGWAMVAVRSGLRSLWEKAKGLFVKPEPLPDVTDSAARARQAWDAVDRTMGTGVAGVYQRLSGATFRPAEVWPHGQAIAAALDIAALTGDYQPVDRTMGALSYYKHGGAYMPGLGQPAGGRFYDDNAWLALDFLQAYNQTGNRTYLDKAKELVAFLEKGMHKDGGLYWVEGARRMSRNTCSNGPAIEAALRLYLATKEQKYLDLARSMDAFLNTRLRSPEGLYYDNLGDDGSLGKTHYTYNQGTPIGADVLWYRITGDRKYLDRATQTARAALDYFGQDDRLWRSAPSFNAIFFRNLLALDQVAPDPRYRQTLEQYLDRAWREGRDPQTGLFGQGGMGHYEGSGPSNLLDQSGMAQMYALLAWPKEKLLDVA